MNLLQSTNMDFNTDEAGLISFVVDPNMTEKNREALVKVIY